MLVDEDSVHSTYNGWVKITSVEDGRYTTTIERKTWRSYHELVVNLPDNLVSFSLTMEMPSL